MWRLFLRMFTCRRRPSPPPARTAWSWEFPPEAMTMPVVELVARNLAMDYAYAMLVSMGLATGDRKADYDQAWEIGCRLRDQHLVSLRKGAEQP